MIRPYSRGLFQQHRSTSDLAFRARMSASTGSGHWLAKMVSAIGRNGAPTRRPQRRSLRKARSERMVPNALALPVGRGAGTHRTVSQSRLGAATLRHKVVNHETR